MLNTDSFGHFFTPSVPATIAKFEAAVIMLAEAFAVGGTPTVADAEAASASQLVNPAMPYSLSSTGDVSGYVSRSGADQECHLDVRLFVLFM